MLACPEKAGVVLFDVDALWRELCQSASAACAHIAAAAPDGSGAAVLTTHMHHTVPLLASGCFAGELKITPFVL